MANSQKWDSAAAYQNQSLAFLDRLASRYASSPALIAIGILNKPTVRSASYLMDAGPCQGTCPRCRRQPIVKVAHEHDMAPRQLITCVFDLCRAEP